MKGNLSVKIKLCNLLIHVYYCAWLSGEDTDGQPQEICPMYVSSEGLGTNGSAQ